MNIWDPIYDNIGVAKFLDNSLSADLHACPYISGVESCGCDESCCKDCLKDEIKILKDFLKEVRKNGKK